MAFWLIMVTQKDSHLHANHSVLPTDAARCPQVMPDALTAPKALLGSSARSSLTHGTWILTMATCSGVIPLLSVW